MVGFRWDGIWICTRTVLELEEMKSLFPKAGQQCSPQDPSLPGEPRGELGCKAHKWLCRTAGGADQSVEIPGFLKLVKLMSLFLTVLTILLQNQHSADHINADVQDLAFVGPGGGLSDFVKEKQRGPGCEDSATGYSDPEPHAFTEFPSLYDENSGSEIW